MNSNKYENFLQKNQPSTNNPLVSSIVGTKSQALRNDVIYFFCLFLISSQTIFGDDKGGLHQFFKSMLKMLNLAHNRFLNWVRKKFRNIFLKFNFVFSRHSIN